MHGQIQRTDDTSCSAPYLISLRLLLPAGTHGGAAGLTMGAMSRRPFACWTRNGRVVEAALALGRASYSAHVGSRHCARSLCRWKDKVDCSLLARVNKSTVAVARVIDSRCHVPDGNFQRTCPCFIPSVSTLQCTPHKPRVLQIPLRTIICAGRSNSQRGTTSPPLHTQSPSSPPTQQSWSRSERTTAATSPAAATSSQCAAATARAARPRTRPSSASPSATWSSLPPSVRLWYSLTRREILSLTNCR